jgi:acid phosphatase
MKTKITISCLQNLVMMRQMQCCWCIHYNVHRENIREITMREMPVRHLMLVCATAFLFACTSDSRTGSGPDRAVRWVRDAAEFDALTMQAYRAAADDLPGLIADKSWTALPGQKNYGQLPPAIIFDVDATVISGVRFQEILVPPFKNSVFDEWNAKNIAKPIPGAAAFAKLARDQGVELFFVTNRPCEKKAGVSHPCPQETVTVQDINEAGIPADSDHVMLANEQPEWDREKVIRRNFIAQNYRIIMLIGDDLSDFIPCVRKKVLEPCDTGATAASRRSQTELFSSYWGAGWYVLPNPMHGSWTTVE